MYTLKSPSKGWYSQHNHLIISKVYLCLLKVRFARQVQMMGVYCANYYWKKSSQIFAQWITGYQLFTINSFLSYFTLQYSGYNQFLYFTFISVICIFSHNETQGYPYKN